MSGIEDLRDSMEDVKERINKAAESQISANQLLSLLTNYGTIYKLMSDLEKKEFFHTLIERIDLYPEYTPDGRILKHIEFKFPVSYDSDDDTIRLINENDVETVVVMSKVK